MKAKNHAKKVSKPIQKAASDKIRIDFILIILAYTIIPVATPTMEAFDANGPKFMTISFLNILVFIWLFFNRKVRTDKRLLPETIGRSVGLAYLLFMMAALVSFTKAINVYEALIHYEKLFTIFTAAFLLAVIMRADKRYARYAAIAMTLMLLFDSMTVLYHISQFVSGKVGSIYEIKSVYSNKNILTAAVFVKIPFALWLFAFDKRWTRALASVVLFTAMLATFFMSTRAFYLGIIFLTLAFLAYLAIEYIRNRNILKPVVLIIQYSVLLLMSFLLYTGSQKFLYPKDRHGGYLSNEYTAGFFSRLESVQQGEGGRIRSWKNTLQMIGEDPLLGVGAGNWKLVVLKLENQQSHDYTYMYKNHNDFMEMTAETGIFGGLFFLLVFLLTGFNFIRMLFTKGSSPPVYQQLFLPAFGLFAYSFDAFFNFPADRPEIGALLAMYVSCAIAYAPVWRQKIKQPDVTLLPEGQPGKVDEDEPASETAVSPMNITGIFQKYFVQTTFPVLFLVFMLLFLTGAAWFFILNFKSIRLQRIVKSEMVTGKLSSSSEKFLAGFPFIPTITLEGEPISVQKARYLLNESKHDQAITLLKSDRYSPYDTRPEFFISMAYYQKGMVDSSIFYSYKVFEQKPLFFNNTMNLCRSLESKGRKLEAYKVIDTYLTKNKTNTDAWLYASSMYGADAGDFKALIVIDTALKYLPGDTTLLKQRRAINFKIKVKPVEAIYARAMDLFAKKDFKEAEKQLTRIIEAEPGLSEVYDFRAFSYFYLNDYQRSINDADMAMKLGGPKPNLLNLRGVNYQMIGKTDLACQDFMAAIKLGDKDAENNYKRFCAK